MRSFHNSRTSGHLKTLCILFFFYFLFSRFSLSVVFSYFSFDFPKSSNELKCSFELELLVKFSISLLF